MITLYCGIYFTSGSLHIAVDVVFIIFIVGVNLYFFIAVLFCYLRTPKIKAIWYIRLVKIVRRIALLNKDYSLNIGEDRDDI